MTFTSIIYEAYFLTKQPVLCVFNQRKYHTLFGLIFSLLVVATLIGFSAYFLDRFFRRTDVTLVYMTDNSGVSNKLNLEDTLFRIQTGTRVIDQSYFSLSLSYFYSSPESSAEEDFEPIKDVLLTTCNDTTVPKEFMGKFKGGYCLSPGQHVEIINEGETVGQLMIAMSLCKNGTNPNITCKSKEEIVEMVKGKTLPFFLDVESERIDHYNVNNPIQKDFFEIQMSPSFGSYYESYVYYQIMTYETDTGYVFEYKKNNYGIYVDPSTFKQQGKIIDNPDYDSGNNLLLITLYM